MLWCATTLEHCMAADSMAKVASQKRPSPQPVYRCFVHNVLHAQFGNLRIAQMLASTMDSGGFFYRGNARKCQGVRHASVTPDLVLLVFQLAVFAYVTVSIWGFSM